MNGELQGTGNGYVEIVSVHSDETLCVVARRETVRYGYNSKLIQSDPDSRRASISWRGLSLDRPGLVYVQC